MEIFKALGCNMSIKLHFLHSHLSNFLENLGKVSDEQGEWFHHDLKVIEERWLGRLDVNMMADFCWSIKRDCSQIVHSRKSYKCKFLPKVIAHNLTYSYNILCTNEIYLYKHYSQAMVYYFPSYMNFKPHNKMSPYTLDTVFYVSLYKVRVS